MTAATGNVAAEKAKQIMALAASPADMHAAVQGFQTGTSFLDIADASVAMVKSLNALQEVLLKIPVIGTTVVVGEFAVIAAKVTQERKSHGYVTAATREQATGALFSLASGLGFVAAGAVAPFAAPAFVAVGVLLAGASIYSGVLATTQGVASKALEADIVSAAAGALEQLNKFSQFRWVADDKRASELLKEEQPLLYPMVEMLHFLAPTLSVADAVRILDSSDTRVDLREAFTALNAIRRLITNEYVVTTLTAEAYMSALVDTYDALQTQNKLGQYTIQAWPTQANTLYEMAKDSADVRTAMVLGAPFYIIGALARPLAPEATTLFNSATGQGALTEEWLRDRSYFMTELAGFRTDDLPLNSNGSFSRQGRESFNIRYEDELSKSRIEIFANRPTPTTLPTRLVVFGTEEVDSIAGEGENDKLYGGSGADILQGMGGDDYLEGGVGADTYLFADSFGNDVVFDADGLGLIQINGDSIGEAEGTGRWNSWRAMVGAGNYAQLTLSELAGGAGYALTIAPQGGGSVTIKNFDLAKAQGVTGYLGLKLEATNKVALLTQNENFWGNPGAQLTSLAGKSRTIQENGSAPFTVSLSQAAKAGDTVSLQLQGLSDKGVSILVNGEERKGETVTLALMEGQVLLGFSLIHDGQLDADAAGSLKVVFNGAAGTAESNTWDLTLRDSGGNSAVLKGDILARTTLASNDVFRFDTEGRRLAVVRQGESIFMRDSYGNLVAGGDILVTSNTIFGTAENDRIEGGIGNDALSGGAGNDRILGGADDDMIAGGSGDDIIDGGDGDDYISSSAVVYDAVQQFGPFDDWLSWGLPVGSTVLAHGSGWGVFNQGGATHWSGMSSTSTLAQSDFIDGGAGDDHIIASWGNDRVVGGLGKDTVAGLAGDDTINGGDGDDDLWGDGKLAAGLLDSTPGNSHGSDFIDGGAGADRIRGGGQGDRLFGGDGDDSIWGDTAAARSDDAEFLSFGHHGGDFIDAGNGNDYVEGNGGDDALYGGTGDDTLWGDTDVLKLSPTLISESAAWGADTLDGGTGNDALVGGGGDDRLSGGAGDDVLMGDQSEATFAGAVSGSDWLDGGTGNDRLYGGGRNDALRGGDGNDVLWGDDRESVLSGAFHGDDMLDGGVGNDQLVGGGRSDILVGGEGDDVLLGDDSQTRLQSTFHGDDQLDGGAGDDLLAGGGGDDHLLGGVGNDILIGDDVAGAIDAEAEGADYLDGGAGDDQLFGSGGDDELHGGDGNDYLVGGAGNDTLDGGAGTEILIGGGGDDILISDGGDTLAGGEGDDTYVLSIRDEGTAPSVIDDQDGHNRLVFEGEGAADVTLFVRNGTVFVGANGKPLVTLTAGTGLEGLSVSDGFGGGVSLQQMAEAEDASGRVHSKEMVGGRLVSTAGISTSQVLLGSGMADALDGGSAADSLDGAGGDDILDGGAGNDVIFGGGGNDLIVGGAGDDVLSGDMSSVTDEEGTDVYLFNVGDGHDIITAPVDADAGDPRDVIQFGAGITADSMQFIRGGSDASSSFGEFTIAYGNGDSVTLSPGAFALIEKLQFSDGTTMGRDEVFARILHASTPDAPSGRRILIEEDEASGLIVGGSGADILIGSSGEDVLVGGAGNDVLDGNWGQNTYVFGANDGADVIQGEQQDGAEHDTLVFTGALLSELEWFLDRNDIVVRQQSGSFVRIRDAGNKIWDSQGEWIVRDKEGQETSLLSLPSPEQPEEPLLLADRRSQFVARQQSQLMTMPQRVAGAALGWTAVAVPTSFQQIEYQMDGNVFVHGTYLEQKDHVERKTGYVTLPIYTTFTQHIPAGLGPVIPSNGSVPPGATPVYEYRVADGPMEPGEVEGGSMFWENGTIRYYGRVVGYQYPAPERFVEVTQLVGYQSYPYQKTVTVADDSARQSSVLGTSGDDLIVPGTGNGAQPVLFRGTISTGNGNDQVLLQSGAAGWSWSRFQDWRASESRGQEGAPSDYDRGLGAWLDLGAGDDIATGTDGDDFIIGGTGSDYMDGQAGADTYYVGFAPGDLDRISDLAYQGFWIGDDAAFGEPNRDVVEFDDTVDVSSLTYRWTRSALEAADAPAGSVRTLQLFSGGQHFLDIDYLDSYVDQHGLSGIEEFRFSDGLTTGLDGLLSTISPFSPPSPPEVVAPLVSQSISSGSSFSIAAGSSFSDPDGTTLTFTAMLLDGSELPSFLVADPMTGLISGQTAHADVGTYVIRVVATDADGMSADSVLDLTVTRSNSAPVLTQPATFAISSFTNQEVVWQVPAGTWTDDDPGDTLRYSVSSATGNALPDWLDFDTASGTLTANAPSGDWAPLQLLVTAIDQVGAVSLPIQVELRVTQAPSVVWRGTDADEGKFGWLGDDDLDGRGGNDWLWGDAGNDRLAGGDGIDVLTGGDGHDLLNGGAGNDQLQGDAGNDQLVGEDGDDTLMGGAGNDLLEGGAGNDHLSGEEGDDHLVAGDGYSVLDGGSGNDLLEVGDGGGELYGGDGDDTFIIGHGFGDVSIFDGEGRNVLSFEHFTSSQLAFTRFFSSLYVTEAETGHRVEIVGWFEAVAPGFTMVFSDDERWGSGEVSAHLEVAISATDDIVWGSASDDTILTLGGNDQAWGEAGNDYLSGGDGDDILWGGAGDDTLEGGAGNDRLSGEDGNDHLIAGTGYSMLEGGTGNDVLVAGTGGAELYGGEGDDTFVIGQDIGQVFISDLEGSNVLSFQTLSSSQLAFTRFFSSLYITEIGTTNRLEVVDWFDAPLPELAVTFGTGERWSTEELQANVKLAEVSTGNDMVWGTGDDDIISSLAGSDRIAANGGNDVVDAGGGDDEIYGGGGLNILKGGSGGDYIDLSGGMSLADGQSGTDILIAGIGHQFLVGGEGEDVVDQAWWRGQQGGGNVIAFNRGDGRDVVRTTGEVGVLSLGGGLSMNDLRLSADLEMGSLTIELGGGDSLVFEGLLSLAASEEARIWTLQVVGDESAQVFDLLAATREYLQAKQADPSLGQWNPSASLLTHQIAVAPGLAFGGALAYEYARSGTTGALTAAEIQSVLASPDFGSAPQPVLPTAQLGTDGPDSISGGELADVLHGRAGDDALEGGGGDDLLLGGAGNDHLDGGSGLDTLYGGTGDDTYFVSGDGDVIVEWGGEGLDTVNTSADLVLGAEIENGRVWNTIAGVSLTGNGLDNQLIGGVGADILAGEAGNDQLAGGRGSDVYFFGHWSGQDRIEEDDLAPGALDLVQFGADVGSDQLWFQRSGDDLAITVVGNDGDVLTVAGWYLGAQHRIEVFSAGDGKSLTEADVQSLVQAMASFAPPPASAMTALTDDRSGLQSVLAANWH
ncbi:MAG TPA: putative Ig domain-containing protein [Ramlibacter sp.]|jgi:Ca2+-binding RTX toxin-like protein|uniref:putative Ig domain-containing protein n=1 Tax=Ramlibacter sp. TaxID=1917967 RepID=UPI002D2B67C6|nr:putative Ig domain-containing protein [Ramlibacter sp.]HZY18093.1 putative Ig domain-containing protein [Ramlibacter sp.]